MCVASGETRQSAAVVVAPLKQRIAGAIAVGLAADAAVGTGGVVVVSDAVDGLIEPGCSGGAAHGVAGPSCVSLFFCISIRFVV